MSVAAPEASVPQLLNDIETLRRSLRLYPESHPALEPARERIRAASTEVAGDAAEGTLSIAPDKIFWNGAEIALSPQSPAARLAQFLFHLGVGAVRLSFPQAGDALPALATRLAGLHDPPGEGDRRELFDAAAALGGLEFVPIDLSSVHLMDSDSPNSRLGSLMVLPELARRLSRDGAFPLAGKIDAGDLTPGMLVDLLLTASDPETLFDHLFLQLGEILRSVPEAQRRPVLGEVRDFFLDLVRLLDPERQKLAIAVGLRHLPVCGGDEDETIWVAAELFLDAVEFMIIQQAPIPPVVHRALHRMAAPAEEQTPRLDDTLAARARHLLAQLPPNPDDGPFGPAPEPAAAPVDWGGAPWVRELGEALEEEQIRGHLVRLLQEAVTIWPDQPAGARAVVRLAEEFANALDIGDLTIAAKLSAVLAATRSAEVREVVNGSGVPAAIRAFKAFDREHHPEVTAILVSLGEGALPAVLDALVEEDSLVVRKRLLEVVARHGDRALPYLYPLLDDSRWYVVRNAVFLLRRLGDRQMVPLVKERLATAQPQVLGEMLKVLVAVEDRQWYALLVRYLDHEDEARRQVALDVASRITHPRVVRAIQQRLHDRVGMQLRDPFSVELVRALGRLRAASSLPLLRSIVGLRQWRFPFPLTTVRREAALAVANLEGAEARALAESLVRDRDPEVAAAIREVLERRSDPEEAE